MILEEEFVPFVMKIKFLTLEKLAVLLVLEFKPQILDILAAPTVDQALSLIGEIMSV